MRFVIREYQSADFDRLCRIEKDCFPSGMAFAPATLAGFIGQPNAIALVAEAGGKSEAPEPTAAWVAGFLVGEKPSRNVGRFIALDVAPEARRRGVATALLTAGEERLRIAGCRQAYLEAAVNNEPALSLYRQHGYRVLKTLPDYYPSHGLDAYQLGKLLTSRRSSPER